MRESDTYQFQFNVHRPDSQPASTSVYVSGRRNHFVCDPRRWVHDLPGKLSPRLLDLLRIAAAVYVADRTSPRDRTHSDFGWHRSLSIEVDVFDIEFWRRQEVSDCLHRCVDFLSGDSWAIGFLKTHRGFQPGSLPFDPMWKPCGDRPVVCLFSGGLDAAGGLVKRIRQCDGQRIIPILVMHQSGQQSIVRDQIARINLAMHANLEVLTLPFWTRKPVYLNNLEESQRSRSFLFCSAAAVLATLVEAQAIEMMEGGIGAVNWPLMAGMVGSKATRNSHPTFLRRFSELLRLIVERDLRVDLPHRYRTKAELARSLHEAGLAGLAPKTASCVHYPLRDSRSKQCGVCAACIFRRQALLVAGIDEPADSYKYDLFGEGDVGASDENLRAFLIQVDKLSSLDHSDEMPRSLVRHLRATEVIDDDHVPMEMLDLYRRYRREWLFLIRRGIQKGWRWSRIVAAEGTEQMEKQHA